MSKKILATMACLSILLPSVFLMQPKQVQAAAADFTQGTNGIDDVLGDKSPVDIIVGIIKIVMSFLGIIAVIIILIGGFKWMTSQGNTTKVEAATKLMTAGIVGMLIILAAWGVSIFVIDNLIKLTDNPAGSYTGN